MGERVQAYTHPLWMGALTAGYALTGEAYLTSIALSIACSLIAFVLLVGPIASSAESGLLAGLSLLLSKAFTDFSTSGLENALSHALLAAFWAVYFTARAHPRRVLILALIAALGTLNRTDTALLFAPALVAAVLRARRWQALAALGAGFAPFLLWTGFAVIYYGFPFPNTAYAKLNTGIDGAETAYQGLLYLFNSLSLDPITLTVILASIVWTAYERRATDLVVVLGMLLYLSYVVRVGGDFMSGRFLTAPLFCAAVLLARSEVRPGGLPRLAAVGLPLLLLGLAAPLSPLRSGGDYQTAVPLSTLFARLREQNGIVDERGLYYRYTGLLRTERTGPWPFYFLPAQGRAAQQTDPAVVVWPYTGLFGYTAGPQLYIVDNNALSDPLLARLPARYDPHWRIGHFTRSIPAGYLETLRQNKNVIGDPGLARYYDHLSLVTRGPLLSAERLRTIWQFNWGAYNDLIDWSRYRYPDLQTATLAELGAVLPEGTPRDDPRVRPFGMSGILVAMPTLTVAEHMQISLDNNDGYRLIFMRDQTVVAEHDLAAATYFSNWLEIPSDQLLPPGLAVHELAIPEAAVAGTFSHIHIVPLYGDGQYALGHVSLGGIDR